MMMILKNQQTSLTRYSTSEPHELDIKTWGEFTDAYIFHPPTLMYIFPAPNCAPLSFSAQNKIFRFSEIFGRIKNYSLF